MVHTIRRVYDKQQKKEDNLSHLLVKNVIYAHDLNKYIGNHQCSKLENKTNQSFSLC